MKRRVLDEFLTFLAGVAGIVFLGIAASNAADNDFGWAALMALLALPGLVAVYRITQTPKYDR